MGATVLLKAATMRGMLVSGMVLIAPMLKIVGLPFSSPVVAMLTGALTLSGFAREVGRQERLSRQSDIRGHPLTSDRERFLRNQSVLSVAPEAAVGPPTIGWVHAALAAMAVVESDSFASRLRVPGLDDRRR